MSAETPLGERARTGGVRFGDTLTPLQMAQNLAASVQRYARQSESDQLSSFINQSGERALTRLRSWPGTSRWSRSRRICTGS